MNPQHEALRKFSYQMNFAMDNYVPHGLSCATFSNILIGGLGGSGIGAVVRRSSFQLEPPRIFNCH